MVTYIVLTISCGEVQSSMLSKEPLKQKTSSIGL
uniref:Uncharacterized protein n=1 Tax=Rhizophora mucronata TaxID=61149 RepID=A0A2P2R4K5_RHIMU